MDKEYYIQVVEIGKEPGQDEVWKEIGPFSSRLTAEKATEGIMRNLDWIKFFTKVVPAKD